MYYKYSKFKANAYPNYLTVVYNNLYDKYVNGIWQNPYEDEQIFAMASPILKYKSLSLTVELPNSLWYTNQTNAVQNIAIDFGDGNGYQTITYGQILSVNYTQEGLYEWKYKLTLTNNHVWYSHSNVFIEGELPLKNNNQVFANRTINEPCAVDTFGIDQVEFFGTKTYLGSANSTFIEIDYRSGNDCNLTRP